MAPVLVALVVAACTALNQVTPATAAQETDAEVFLRDFRPAWASGDVRHVLALFAPEAVVALNYREPGGPSEYWGGLPGSMTLRDGVALLLESGHRPLPDLATVQTAPTVFGGAPATTLRWTYRRASLVPGVPPEVGTDELVLQGGLLVSYTRTPDGTNEAIRLLALDRAASRLAALSGSTSEGAGAAATRWPADGLPNLVRGRPGTELEPSAHR